MVWISDHLVYNFRYCSTESYCVNDNNHISHAKIKKKWNQGMIYSNDTSGTLSLCLDSGFGYEYNQRVKTSTFIYT